MEVRRVRKSSSEGSFLYSNRDFDDPGDKIDDPGF